MIAAALPHVAFDGWSDRTLAQAVEDAGVDPGLSRLAFPRGGVDLALAFHNDRDAALAADLASADLLGLRFRDRIAYAIMRRLELVADDREAVRRGAALFALPNHAADGARAIWHTADTIWTALGDDSRDFTWYSKRTTLSAVYSSALLYWLGDDTPRASGDPRVRRPPHRRRDADRGGQGADPRQPARGGDAQGAAGASLTGSGPPGILRPPTCRAPGGGGAARRPRTGTRRSGMALGSSVLTWYDGRWHDGNRPIMGAADHGTWQGTLVFDGARAFEGVTPDLDRHCARFIALRRGDGPRRAARRRARSRRWCATASAASAPTGRSTSGR